MNFNLNQKLDSASIAGIMTKLNNKNGKMFKIRLITEEDFDIFLERGYNAGIGYEEEYFILDNPVPKSEYGILKCFVIENDVTKDVICTFSIQAHYVEGKIYLEICHLTNEHRFTGLLKFLGYKHVGFTVFENFAIPMAQAFKTVLNADNIFGLVPNERKLKKLFKTKYFKALPKRESEAFKRLIDNRTDRVVYMMNR